MNASTQFSGNPALLSMSFKYTDALSRSSHHTYTDAALRRLNHPFSHLKIYSLVLINKPHPIDYGSGQIPGGFHSVYANGMKSQLTTRLQQEQSLLRCGCALVDCCTAATSLLCPFCKQVSRQVVLDRLEMNDLGKK